MKASEAKALSQINKKTVDISKILAFIWQEALRGEFSCTYSFIGASSSEVESAQLQLSDLGYLIRKEYQYGSSKVTFITISWDLEAQSLQGMDLPSFYDEIFSSPSLTR